MPGEGEEEERFHMNRFMVMAIAVEMLAAGAAARAAEVEIPKGWHYEACKHAEADILLRVEYSLEGISKVYKNDFFFRKSKRQTDEGVTLYFGRMVLVESPWSSASPVINDKGPHSLSIDPGEPTDKGIELRMSASWTENRQKKKVEEKFLVPYQRPLVETRGRLSLKAHFEQCKGDSERK